LIGSETCIQFSGVMGWSTLNTLPAEDTQQTNQSSSAAPNKILPQCNDYRQ